MPFHYDVQLIVTANEFLIGAGVTMVFRETPTGPTIPVTDYSGAPITLTTSPQSLTPRFVAPYANGFLSNPSGSISLPVQSSEAANALDAVTEMQATKADLTGATFTGPVSVPTATGPTQPVTLAQMQAAIAAGGGTGGTGGGGYVDPTNPNVYILP